MITSKVNNSVKWVRYESPIEFLEQLKSIVVVDKYEYIEIDKNEFLKVRIESNWYLMQVGSTVEVDNGETKISNSISLPINSTLSILSIVVSLSSFITLNLFLLTFSDWSSATSLLICTVLLLLSLFSSLLCPMRNSLSDSELEGFDFQLLLIVSVPSAEIMSLSLLHEEYKDFSNMIVVLTLAFIILSVFSLYNFIKFIIRNKILISILLSNKLNK